jgi:hypothetical protein
LHKPLAARARHGGAEVRSLGSVGQPVSTKLGGSEMFKRLFLAVLGFWLLKKYVKPYFDDRHEAAAIDEA